MGMAVAAMARLFDLPSLGVYTGARLSCLRTSPVNGDWVL